MSLHSNWSVWDGNIIPHIQNDSPTNKVFSTLWYMKKEAYADSTIGAVGNRLRHLSRNCNLNNPEDVKGFIARKNCSYGF